MDDHQPPGVTDPTALQPPGQLPDAAKDGSAAYRWIWVALGGLVLLSLAVMFALPNMVTKVQTPAAAVQSPPPSQPSSNDGAARDLAHQTLQTYLRERARLELENAAAWGEPDWSEAATLVAAGDHDFAQRQFEAAGQDYQAALDMLRQIETNRSALLASALEEAARAMAVNDVDTAVARFEAALVIEPEHPQATQGLVQAQSRLASLGQMERGSMAESEGDTDAALAAYLQAAQLDAGYVPAREAVQRMTAQINAREFTAAMTRALTALDAGQTAAANKALDEAEKLQPGDSAVSDARRRAQGMRAQAGLTRLRRQAANKVGREDWPAAADLYRKALAIDPGAAFARIGLRRAQERTKLHAQFDHYLDKPARLYSAKPLANAEQLLETASKAPSNEPRLAAKISALRELVARAGTPMTLTLKSDGATDVVVYRVGRLGQFDTHQLQLLPGDYTIVGSRPGYRDVRKVISLRPGVSPSPLLVRCEEAI